MPKALKQKQPTNTIDSLNVDLKFDKDEKRTWVNKDKFLDFEAEYNDTQDNSALNSASDVEFAIHIKLLTYNEDPSKRREVVEKVWISMTTVLGGINGVKLFIKKRLWK